MKFSLQSTGLFFLIFALGVGSGALLEECKMDHKSEKRLWHSGHEEDMMKQLSSKLNLSDEQKQEIDTIIKETEPKIKSLRMELWPKFDEIRKNANAQIRSILSTDQQQKFDRMEAEWQERVQKKRSQ